METDGGILEKIERDKKRVKFSENTKKDENATFTPLSKPSLQHYRKKWIEYSRDGNNSELEKIIKRYQDKNVSIEDLFSKEGESIVEWILCISPNSQPLRFILTHYAEVLQSTLEKENFRLIDQFLNIQKTSEKYAIVDDKFINNQIEKINLLLQIASENMNKFFIKKISEESIGTNIKKTIEKALRNPVQSQLQKTSKLPKPGSIPMFDKKRDKSFSQSATSIPKQGSTKKPTPSKSKPFSEE